MKTHTLYKFLREGMKSDRGNHTWEVGTWYKVEKELKICDVGFHASKTPLQALGYVAGEILAEVEVRGQSIIEDDKECWSEMRVVKALKWQKKDSVALSIYAAELCLKNFEKVFPNDKRPRKAIEAARKWLAEPTKENESAARSAARSAAWSAWSAARSAAWSAWSAARSAARSAAESARSAARSAAESARSAESAKKKLIASLDTWFIKQLKKLEPYEV